jgi:hypothetical protein
MVVAPSSEESRHTGCPTGPNEQGTTISGPARISGVPNCASNDHIGGDPWRQFLPPLPKHSAATEVVEHADGGHTASSTSVEHQFRQTGHKETARHCLESQGGYRPVLCTGTRSLGRHNHADFGSRLRRWCGGGLRAIGCRGARTCGVPPRGHERVRRAEQTRSQRLPRPFLRGVQFVARRVRF